MTPTQATQKRPHSPLLYPAVFLSLASLAWTTWSLFDLLGTGPSAITAASGADLVWGSVIIAEARGLRVAGKKWIVPTVGWITLLIVVAFLALHGIEKNSLALAVVGPFLPLGAKVIWVFALTDMRDPAALTHDELHTLAAMERGMAFEEQQHRIEMRRRQMGAELLMAEVSTDFDIELTRMDRERELVRRRPLEPPAATRTDTNALEANGANEQSELFARLASDSPLTTDANDLANDANTAGHTPQTGTAFGFSAALPNTHPVRPHTANGSPRKANTNTPRTANANDTNKANSDPREAAAADYRTSVQSGAPLSGAELGRRYGRTARWGQKVIAELKTA